MKRLEFVVPIPVVQDEGNGHQTALIEYKRLFEQTVGFFESHEVDQILDTVAEAIAKIVDFSAMAYLAKEYFSDDFYIRKDWNVNRTQEKQILRLEHSGYVDQACESNKIFVYPENGEQNGSKRFLVIPLVAGVRIVGALVVLPSLAPKKIGHMDYDLLAMVGNQAAVALENAGLREDMALKNHATSSIERFLENSIECIPDGLFAIDLEKKFSLFNSAAAELLGVTRDHALGSRYDDLFDKDFSAFLDNAFKVTHTTGEYENEISFSQPGTDKKFPLGVHTSILQDFNESLIGTIGVCRDLTEQKELVHLRHLDKMKDEFLSAVSHELRTPLTAIKSFTELMSDFGSHKPEARQEFLDIIAKQTDQLMNLIEDLLDTGQIGRDEFELKISAVNLEEVLAESLHSLQGMIDKKNITFDLKLDEGHRRVQADSKRLVQVFINIIGNAIKFSPGGSIIKICSNRIARQDSDDDRTYLRIAVEDEGKGILKDSRKLIFEKFSQIRDDPATKPDGSGLGLWICKQIIEKMEGSIWVEAAVGKGSTFFFTLPLSKTTPPSGNERQNTA